MMSGSQIASMSRKAAMEAAVNKREPVIMWPEDVGNVEACTAIPLLGDYEPPGWSLIESHFVDSSGFGSACEPAMTVQVFADKIVPGHGYGLIECGQFQVYVGEFVCDEDMDDFLKEGA